jgi:hypothetical protein
MLARCLTVLFVCTWASAQEARVFQVPDSSTVVHWWVEAGGERYQVSLDGGASWHPVQEAETRVMLHYAQFDPRFGEPAVASFLKARDGARLHLIQFVTQPLDAYFDALRARGVVVHQYIPFQACLARMDAATAAAVAALPFVRWVGPFHPAYKFAPGLLSEIERTAALLPTAKFDISTVDRYLDDQARLVEAVGRIGGEVHTAPVGNFMIEAMLNGPQLLEVAAEDTVMSLSRWGMVGEDMNNARIQGGANYIEPLKPERYTGKGIRGEILEGIYQTHPEFAATVHRQIPIIHRDGTATSHGNSTFGEVFSAGVQPLARGLLPDGQGMYCNYNFVINTNNRYLETQELVDPLGQFRGMFQTASWGYPQVTTYTDRSREMDIIIFDFDLPVTQSQSNTGNQTSRPQAWAKNIISVGALNHYETPTTPDDRWTSASIGPASDGRIKPDLCAYYDGIYTTNTLTTPYTTGFGGTSGATPIVAGHVGLSLELYTDGLFGHPMPGATRFDNRPHFTTTKAHLINTARQYPFGQLTVTRYNQGWGWPSVMDMYDLRQKTHIVNEWDVLTSLQTKRYTFFVNPGEAALRTTLTWSDPAAAANAVIHIINDLNLKVTAPNGTSYWGNNGLASANWSTPGGVANARDTVENVFVQNPATGLWTVDVTAAVIAQDGRPTTPGNDVDYALVVSGLGSGRNKTRMVLDLHTTGGTGDFRSTVTGIPAGYSQGWTFLSFQTSLPAGLGSFIGFEIDALFLPILNFPAIEGNLLHFTATANPAAYPNAAWTYPAGTLLPLLGLSVDGVVVVLDGAAQILAVSNVDRITF